MSHPMSFRGVCVLLLLASAPLGAQDAVLRAKERAQMLTDFRAMLEHSDAATRMAAFEEAVASKDPALMTLAMDAAFGGTDANLKTAALRAYLHGRQSLPITVILPDRASEGMTSFFSTWNGLTLEQVTVQGNEIGARAPRTFESGQLISSGIDLRFAAAGGNYRCSLVARLVATKQMAGSLDCSMRPNIAPGITRAVYPVRIDLP